LGRGSGGLRCKYLDFTLQTTSEELRTILGPHWWGMGRELLAKDPVFRDTIHRCEELIQKHAGWSLLEQMTVSESDSRMSETQVSQPANLAIQTGLMALWNHWGIVPNAIVGHSTGEVGACFAAGMYSLEDAVRIVVHRSRLQQQATGTGMMLAAGLSRQEAREVIAGAEDRVSIGAVNSPSSVTLSGDEFTLKQIGARLEKDQKICKFLRVDVPYHSPKMDPLRTELFQCLSNIQPQASIIPIYSTVTGNELAGLIEILRLLRYVSD